MRGAGVTSTAAETDEAILMDSSVTFTRAVLAIQAATASTSAALRKGETSMPDDNNGRKALHAYVSDDAHDHWHGFAAEQGVSVSAILEALAPELSLDAPMSHEQLGARLNTVIKSARKIDAQRRRRRR